jgi:hypothetical protein
MAGHASNVLLWTEADVLVYDTAVTALPGADVPDDTDDAFSNAVGKWQFLGLLVGDSGIEQSREWTEKDIPAWGYGTIKIARKDFKLTTKVSALEDNLIVQKILWPDSSDTTLKVPHPMSRFIAFEKRSADGDVHRLISTMPADLWVPNIKDVEGDANTKEISVRIFANSAEELYTVQSSRALTS